jgi:hypothetical protein
MAMRFDMAFHAADWVYSFHSLAKLLNNDFINKCSVSRCLKT